jgi:hydrogenase nickel incorporation protein HypA/HybF
MLMHETMVAQSLMEIILAEAVKQKAKPVSAKISCGTLNAINDEVLRFAFEAVTKDTSCEGVELHIKHIPIRAHCNDCGREFEVDLSNPECPTCKIGAFELLPDAPLIIEEISFQTD